MIETKEYQPELPPPDRDKFQESMFRLVGWFSKEFWPKYGKYSTVVTLALFGALFYWYYQNSAAKSQIPADANQLGVASIASLQGQVDAEKKALETSISKVQTPIIRSQAALRLGNLHYAQRNFVEAEKWYQKATVDAAESPIVKAGAEHGLAALQMQKGNYSGAVSKWESFLNTWSKRKVGVLAEGENEDSTPLVPDAMWQLALCYQELGQKDKAKLIAQKILSLYGDSENGRYAGLAQSLLDQL